MTAKETEKHEALETLRSLLRPGQTVYTILRHVSRSGMSRSISALLMEPDGPRDISHLVSRVLGSPLDRNNGGVKVGGCGMDMGFYLVYELSYSVFPSGFGCIGKGCPSCDHFNGDRDYTPHMDYQDRIGSDGTPCTCHAYHWHKSGGYALCHNWI